MATAFLKSTNHVLTIALIVALCSVTGCRKSNVSTTTPPSNRAKIDACTLITKEEVQAIQGSTVKDTKSSENTDVRFRIGQCFYTADPFNKSVSLAVTQGAPGSPHAKNPKDFWQETFGRYDGEMKAEDGDEEKKKSLGEREREEEGEKSRPPKKLD